MNEKEYTPRNILSFIGFGATVILGISLMTGCDEDLRTPEEKRADIPTVPVFEPYRREFKLDDGTPCVMFWTSPATQRRAGSSGVVCNWNYKESE